MSKDLFAVSGKVALVTGGTSGIGLMIARGLVEHGAKTYIVARNAAACEKTAQELSRSGLCFGLPGDLSTVSGIEDVVNRLAEREPGLHVLVNNAGMMSEAPIEEFAEADWDDVVSLNLKSPFFLVQKCLPLLRAAADHERPARVINIGSVGGLKVGPKENYAYQASKAGIHYLSRSLAKRLSGDNITVNAIAPGLFASEMTPMTPQLEEAIRTMVPRKRQGNEDDIAGTVIFLASAAGAYVTGALITLDGGVAI